MTVAEDPAKAAEPDVHVPPPTAPPVVQATVVETKPDALSALDALSQEILTWN